jgi:hypothetical protein
LADISKSLQATAGYNGVVAPASLLVGPIALVDWGIRPVLPEFYFNFASVVEAVVLNDRIITVGGVEFDEPFVNALRQAGVLFESVKIARGEIKIDKLKLDDVQVGLVLQIASSGGLEHPYFRKLYPIFEVIGMKERFAPYAEKARKLAGYLGIPVLDHAPDITSLSTINDLMEYATKDYLETVFRKMHVEKFVKYKVSHLLHSFDVPHAIRMQQQSLYESLKVEYKEKIDSLRAKYFLGVATVEIPPLATLLLKRSKGDRGAIVPELLKLRHEFKNIRELQANFAKQVANAKSYHDLDRIDVELQRTWKELTAKLSERKPRWILRLWDYIKLLNPTKIATKLVDEAIEHEMQIEHYRAFQSYYALWRECLEQDFNVGLLSKTFGEPLEGIDAQLIFSSFAQQRTA